MEPGELGEVMGLRKGDNWTDTKRITILRWAMPGPTQTQLLNFATYKVLHVNLLLAEGRWEVVVGWSWCYEGPSLCAAVPVLLYCRSSVFSV